jgi:hypothetical protein
MDIGRALRARYVAFTRVWVLTTLSGTGGPKPVVSDVLDLSSTGLPIAVTRVAATSHCAAMQGSGVPGGTVKVQPAIEVTSVCTATGVPPSVTRIAVGMIVALPPWGHCTVESTAITSDPMRYLLFPSECLHAQQKPRRADDANAPAASTAATHPGQ